VLVSSPPPFVAPDLTPPSSETWTHLPVTPALLDRLHRPFTQATRRCFIVSVRSWLPTYFPQFNRWRL